MTVIIMIYFDPRRFVPNSSRTVDCLLRRCGFGEVLSGDGREFRRKSSFLTFSLELGSAGETIGGGSGGSVITNRDKMIGQLILSFSLSSPSSKRNSEFTPASVTSNIFQDSLVSLV